MLTDKSIIYVIQEYRGDIYKKIIIRDTWQDIEDFITDWIAVPHQASYNLQVYKIVFTRYNRPQVTLIKVIPED